MPANKAAAHRHLILDNCLRNTLQCWTRKTLLDMLNERLADDGLRPVSESQIRNDIEALKTEYGAPVEEYKEGRRICYRYEDPEFSIRNLPLSEEDISRLKDAAQLLQGIRGFAQMTDISDVLERLESRLYLGTGPTRQLVAFDHSPPASGQDWLEDLYQAAHNHSVLKVAYKKFGQAEASHHILHPYFLKQYNHRWYVLGHDPERPYVVCLALDRIEEIRVVNQTYIPNEAITPDAYFEEVIGVTIYEDSEPEEVVLDIGSFWAQYVTTKPIHGSQKILETREDGGIRVMVKVRINPELESLIRSYGSHACVLQPESLRNNILNDARQMLTRYAE